MIKKETKKPFYKSKTKWAALLIAVGPVLATIGAMLSGQIDFGTMIAALTPQVGVVLGVFGIYDLVNRKKK